MKSKIAYLFTNPSPSLLFSNYNNMPKDALIIGVDGGTNDLEKLGIEPGIIIGDMDSISPTLLQKYESKIPVISYPSEKDETDCELAVKWCVEQKFEEILIINSLEGRFDHVLGMIQNLYFAKEYGIKARIESATQQIFILENDQYITGKQGMYLSLVPLSALVSNVKTEGLLYPLDGEDLYQYKSRGISNVFEQETVRIQHDDGDLLAILTV